MTTTELIPTDVGKQAVMVRIWELEISQPNCGSQ